MLRTALLLGLAASSLPLMGASLQVGMDVSTVYRTHAMVLAPLCGNSALQTLAYGSKTGCMSAGLGRLAQPIQFHACPLTTGLWGSCRSLPHVCCCKQQPKGNEMLQ